MAVEFRDTWIEAFYEEDNYLDLRVYKG